VARVYWDQEVPSPAIRVPSSRVGWGSSVREDGNGTAGPGSITTANVEHEIPNITCIYCGQTANIKRLSMRLANTISQYCKMVARYVRQECHTGRS
jgi:hypothetical protein